MIVAEKSIEKSCERIQNSDSIFNEKSSLGTILMKCKKQNAPKRL